MKEKIKLFKVKKEDIFILLPLIFIFSAILVLNLHIPLMADDFLNKIDINHNRINSIFQVIQNLIRRYYNENGRIFSHGIGGILLMFNQKYIAILNSTIFCILIYQIFKFIDMEKYESKNSKIIISTLYILIVFLLIWKFTPAFGQVFLWRIGAANYLWTSVFILAMVLSIKKVYKDRCVRENGKNNIEIKKIILYIILSFITGSTNENPVVGVMVILFAYMYLVKFKHKESIKSYIAMFISMLTGYILMLTAPGNFKRINYFKESPYLIERYLNRLDNMFHKFYMYILILFLLAVTIYIISSIVKYDESESESGIYILAALATFFSMIMSPTFPSRAMIMTVVFLIMAIMISINNIFLYTKICGYLLILFALCLGLFFFIKNYPQALSKNIEYEKKYEKRERIIYENKKKGVLDNIVVPEVKAGEDKYEAAFELDDIEKDNPKNWMNKSISWYYGVNSVTLK